MAAPPSRSSLRAPVPVVEIPVVEIVVPVRDEERALEPAVRRLHTFLRDEFPWAARIVIADNGSSDRTWTVASALAAELDHVRAVRLTVAGRGRALHAVWSESDADVVAYTDVDLSTDLHALLPLVAPLISGHSDVAIGNRLARTSRVIRGPKRSAISRSYNLLLHASLQVKFSDAQCGFKAVRADVARALLPYVEDRAWFFDTELLVLAERAGMRIHEVPVDWVDDADSRVRIVPTAVGDLRGIARVGWSLARGRLPITALREQFERAPLVASVPSSTTQVFRFACIGALSTVAYLLLYVLFRLGMGAQAANALSLLVTAIGNTSANRRLTFGVRGGAGALGHQLRGLVAFAAGLGLTSGSLALLHAEDPGPGRVTELAVLIGATVAATVVRFALYRWWVFREPPARPAAEAAALRRDAAEIIEFAEATGSPT